MYLVEGAPTSVIKGHLWHLHHLRCFEITSYSQNNTFSFCKHAQMSKKCQTLIYVHLGCIFSNNLVFLKFATLSTIQLLCYSITHWRQKITTTQFIKIANVFIWVTLFNFYRALHSLSVQNNKWTFLKERKCLSLKQTCCFSNIDVVFKASFEIEKHISVFYYRKKGTKTAKGFFSNTKLSLF